MELINAVPVFNMLSRWQKALISDGVQVTQHAPGAIVCVAGEQGRCMTIVKAGELTAVEGADANGRSLGLGAGESDPDAEGGDKTIDPRT